MNKIKNYLKTYSYYLIMILVYLIIMSIICYTGIINYKTISIINFIASLIMFFIIGYKISILEGKRGYLNGFFISVILVLFYMLISLILSKLSFSSLVYYLSLILSSMVGGILGVSKK